MGGFDRFGARVGYGGFGGSYGGAYGYGDPYGYGYGPYDRFGGGPLGGGGFDRFGRPFGGGPWGGRMGYGRFGGGFGGRPMGGGLLGLAATLIDASDRGAREVDGGMQTNAAMDPRTAQTGQPGMGRDGNYYQGRDVGTAETMYTGERGVAPEQNGGQGAIGSADNAGGVPSGDEFVPKGAKRSLGMV
jgi:hypothetical protein